MSEDHTDLLIVGAGPAGMAAAITARGHGLSVRVVDDQPAPGGQIWRGIESVEKTPHLARLGDAYRAGADRATAFRACGALYEPQSQLWQIEPGFRAFLTREGQARIVTATAVILATGAQERPAPFPGWTLPGVLTVGAAQILLKTANSVPASPVWIAGCGPLPLLYMTQSLAAGGRIAGFLDTTPRGRIGAALRHLPWALRRFGDLTKGLSWSLALKRAGFPIIRHVRDLRAEGDGRLERLRYRTADGRDNEVVAEVLLVHEGVVPNIHAPLALGCAVTWHAAQHCYVPVLDAWGETSQANIFVAGDGAGIGGADAAEPRGRLAALRVASRLGKLSEAGAEAAARTERVALSHALALRPLLDVLYAPRPQVFAPADETLVCRCEEVTAGELRARAVEGRPGPNQLKAFTRAGMGPCQGRQCGYTVAHIVAAAQNRPVEEVGFFRIRPPLKPVTLGELASLDEKEAGGMSAEAFDTAVIGGGLHGLSAALHLARAGRRTVVIERRWMGRHASGATAAGVRTLNRDIAEIPISLEAMEMWHRIGAIVGDDCGFRAHGQILVAETEEHMSALSQRQARTRSQGYGHEEIIDAAELRRLVPTLSPHCVGALVARRDGAADPHRTILAFRRACEAEGVVLAEGCGVGALERCGADWMLICGSRRFRAPVVVNAAGAWASRIAALFGDEIPLGVRASMMIATERLAPLLAPVVSVAGRALSFKQSGQGTLVIGGGLQGSADLDHERSTVNFAELAKGARAAGDLFPIVWGVRIARCWTGIEAQTCDRLPIIGASPNAPGLFHAFGFSGHGFQLVPIVGAILAELVTQGGTRRDITAFAPQRLTRERIAA